MASPRRRPTYGLEPVTNVTVGTFFNDVLSFIVPRSDECNSIAARPKGYGAAEMVERVLPDSAPVVVTFKRS